MTLSRADSMAAITSSIAVRALAAAPAPFSPAVSDGASTCGSLEVFALPSLVSLAIAFFTLPVPSPLETWPGRIARPRKQCYVQQRGSRRTLASTAGHPVDGDGASRHSSGRVGRHLEGQYSHGLSGSGGAATPRISGQLRQWLS